MSVNAVEAEFVYDAEDGLGEFDAGSVPVEVPDDEVVPVTPTETAECVE